MLISRRHRFIFIHIYKNAGISITTALMPFAATQNQIQVDNILKKFGMSYLTPVVVKDNSPTRDWISDILNKVFKRFFFLRPHPQPFLNHVTATEIISGIGRETFDAYFSFGIVRNPWDWQVSLYQFGLESTTNPNRRFFQSLSSFENYIHWRCTEDVHYQKDFLFSENGEQLVDFIGKYENLEVDFLEICQHIGISAVLPKLNSTRHKPYHELYTSETAALVRKTFAQDIELFGYAFD